MKQCVIPSKGINCDHMIDTESAVVYCELDKGICSFKKINFNRLMQEKSEIDVKLCK